MKRSVVIFCCLSLLFASAAWALEKCKVHSQHGGHENHSDQPPHLGELSPDKTSRDFHSHDDTVVHCADFDLQIGPMVRLSTGIDFSRVMGVAMAAVPMEAIKITPKAGFVRVYPSGFLNGKTRHLSLSVLQI